MGLYTFKRRADTYVGLNYSGAQFDPVRFRLFGLLFAHLRGLFTVTFVSLFQNMLNFEDVEERDGKHRLSQQVPTNRQSRCPAFLECLAVVAH